MDNVLEVYNSFNKKEKIKVIKYFKLKSLNRKFILYKRQSYDLIYSAEVIVEGDEVELKEITDKKIIKMIKEVLAGIKNE